MLYAVFLLIPRSLAPVFHPLAVLEHLPKLQCVSVTMYELVVDRSRNLGGDGWWSRPVLTLRRLQNRTWGRREKKPRVGDYLQNAFSPCGLGLLVVDLLAKLKSTIGVAGS